MLRTWKTIMIVLTVILLCFSAFSFAENTADESVLPEEYYQ